mgnify:CR=1 FL=1
MQLFDVVFPREFPLDQKISNRSSWHNYIPLISHVGLRGFGVKLYQLATGGATDTSNRPSLAGNLEGVTPIRKRLVFDFASVPFAIDNLEAITLGPRLPDGSQSLILATDNNFQSTTATQLILLRLHWS